MARTKTKSTKKSEKSDLFAVIHKDHTEVSGLFKKLEKANGEKAESLYAELRTALTAHAEAEERAVYPQLRQREKTKDIALEALEEHDLIKHLFSKLDGMSPEDEEWNATVYVLKEIVDHHVEEEESTMFARMRKAFDKEERHEVLMDFEDAKSSYFGAEQRVA